MVATMLSKEMNCPLFVILLLCDCGCSFLEGTKERQFIMQRQYAFVRLALSCLKRRTDSIVLHTCRAIKTICHNSMPPGLLLWLTLLCISIPATCFFLVINNIGTVSNFKSK